MPCKGSRTRIAFDNQSLLRPYITPCITMACTHPAYAFAGGFCIGVYVFTVAALPFRWDMYSFDVAHCFPFSVLILDYPPMRADAPVPVVSVVVVQCTVRVDVPNVVRVGGDLVHTPCWILAASAGFWFYLPYTSSRSYSLHRRPP